MRSRLNQVFSDGAEFLILDEPTNDLDREGREMVADFLRAFRGGVLLISHDREILNLCDEVIELSNRGLKKFGGSWADYQGEREHERAALSRDLETAKRARDSANASRLEKIAAQEKRNRREKAAGLAGGLPKILLGARKRRAQVTSGRIDHETNQAADRAVSEAHSAYAQVKIDPLMYADLPRITMPTQKLIAEVSDFNMRYRGTDRWLYSDNFSISIRGPTRVAILGANGSGKTSLLKMLLGDDESFEARGEIRRGNFRSMYVDQTCAQLDDEMTVIENVQAVSTLSEPEIRNGLAKFLFQREMVFQKARDLSGGERLRLAMACGYLSGNLPELIVLDEPTNNLDMANIEFLEGLLRTYQGALIVISHDEVFLENLVLTTEITCSRGEG